MLRLSSYSAFWWARSTPRIQKVSKVLQKFRKIIFQMSNGPFPRKYDGADWHALRLFFTGPFMCRLLKKSYEIMFPDPMSFYKSNHKPSHSPFGGHGFSHPSARWAPAYRFRLCGGERLLSGSDDFTLFLWRPLASWRQDGGRKPWEMGMVN